MVAVNENMNGENKFHQNNSINLRSTKSNKKHWQPSLQFWFYGQFSSRKVGDLDFVNVV